MSILLLGEIEENPPVIGGTGFAVQSLTGYGGGFAGKISKGTGFNINLEGGRGSSSASSVSTGAEVFIDTGEGLGTWVIPESFSTIDIFRCILTGDQDGLEDIELPLVSFSARLKNVEQTYLQAVLSWLTAEQIDDVFARQNGRIQIQKGIMDVNSLKSNFATIVDVNFDYMTPYKGPTSQSSVLVGYASKTYPIGGVVELAEVVSTDFRTDGTYSTTCPIDFFLQPGHTVKFESVSYEVSQINYVNNENSTYMMVMS